MIIKLNRDHFSSGLALVASLVGSKATMPVLANVLIEAKGDRVALRTTNLDVGIRANIAGEVKEGGAVTLPVRRLAEIVRELPNVDVTLEVTANHQAKLTSGGSTFRIMGIGQEEFPALPEFADEKTYGIAQDTLQSMIRGVAFAQSTDETRYVLNGVFFTFEDERLTLVATDGRRLATAVSELPHAVAKSGTILPAKTVGELARLLGKGEKAKINFSDRRASFFVDTEKDGSGLVDGVYLYSKVVEGNFPNYRQVIPNGKAHRIKLDREEFLGTVHRAALVCTEKANSVKLKVTSNLMEITAQSPDFGEAHESLAIAFEEATEVRVAFNPHFLMDPLNAVPHDEVFFEFKDEASPGVYKTADNRFLCVIMPVRLS